MNFRAVLGMIAAMGLTGCDLEALTKNGVEGLTQIDSKQTELEQPSPAASPSASPTPSMSPSPSPSPSPSKSPSPSPSPSPSKSPSPSPSPSPSKSPSPSPSPSPTATSTPTTPAGTTPISFTTIPYSDPDIVAPGRGAEIWHDMGQAINIPVEGQGFQTHDLYYRINWTELEGNTEGSYNWTKFDSLMNQAIANRRKLGFGIMTQYPGGPKTVQSGGAGMHYPLYVHNAMMNEPVKPWVSGGTWVPNWNSETYLTRLEALHVALNEHIETASYQGVRYKDAIAYIDVRGYGAFGEWHVAGIADSISAVPQGARATAATMKRIIDTHVRGFPNIQLQAMISMFDGDRLNNTRTPIEVAYHALTVRNNVGLLGWRRDNWGATDQYIRLYLDQNNITYNGLHLATEIMNRWKFAPINGEPMNGGTNSGGNCHYYDLENQVRRYRAVQFGNGNYAGLATSDCAKTNIRNAFKASGYRLVLNGGGRTAQVAADRKLTVDLKWRNVGLTPTYENWNVMFELRNSMGNTVWSGKSSMVLRLYLPESQDKSVVDTFVLPGSLAAGNYTLHLVVRDPNGFRSPLPLAIQGRANDGSYSLGSVRVQ